MRRDSVPKSIKKTTVAFGIDFACYSHSLCICMSVLLFIITNEILGKYVLLVLLENLVFMVVSR